MTVDADEMAEQIIARSIERLKALHEYAGRPAWEQVVAEEIRAALSSRSDDRLREARQIAFDQQSDDPAPGDWNDACLHIAQMIEARTALEALTDKGGGE